MPNTHHPYMQDDGSVKMPDAPAGEQTPGSADPATSAVPQPSAEGQGAAAPPAQQQQPAATPPADAQPASAPAAQDQQPPDPSPATVAPQTEMVAPDQTITLNIGPNLHAEVAKLLENPQVAHVLTSVAGRKAAEKARRLEAELETANAQLRQFEREKQRTAISAMSPEDIAARMKDPAFATAYSQSLQEDDDEDEVATAREFAYYRNQQEELYSEAAGVMDQGKLEAYSSSFKGCHIHDRGVPGSAGHAFWDHNAQGGMLLDDLGDPALARKAAFDRFVNAFRKDLEKLRVGAVTAAAQPAAAPPAAARGLVQPPAAEGLGAAIAEPGSAPPAQEVIGRPNQALQAVAPDASRGTAPGGRTGAFKYSRAEVQQMSWEERIAAWPNAGDFEKALLAGEVEPPEGFDPRVLQSVR